MERIPVYPFKDKKGSQLKYRYLCDTEVHRMIPHSYTCKFRDQYNKTIPITPKYAKMLNSMESYNYYKIGIRFRQKIEILNGGKQLEFQRKCLQIIQHKQKNDKSIHKATIKLPKPPKQLQIPAKMQFISEMLWGNHDKYPQKIRIHLSIATYDILSNSLEGKQDILNGPIIIASEIKAKTLSLHPLYKLRNVIEYESGLYHEKKKQEHASRLMYFTNTTIYNNNKIS
eukprot:UN05634